MVEKRQETDRRYIVPGLSRGLALLQLFTQQRPDWTLGGLAETLRISRSAIYRLVYTLETEGFLCREQSGRSYKLTSRVLQLGYEYFNAQNLSEVAELNLRFLSNEYELSAFLAILDGWHAVYLIHTAAPGRLTINLKFGSRLPAHSTASGRVLICNLEDNELRQIYSAIKSQSADVAVPASFEMFKTLAREDRRKGYVYHKPLRDTHVHSCAAPVFGARGTIIAAITVIGLDSQMEQLRGESGVTKLVKDQAAKISAEMGWKPPQNEAPPSKRPVPNKQPKNPNRHGTYMREG